MSPRRPPADEASILRSLGGVEAERQRRTADAALAARVTALKAWQQTRFELTHANLLAEPRTHAAARFFLDELYGPADFARRDAQFVRIVPALVRLFPQGIVETVATLAELHARTESLDSAMAQALPRAQVDAPGYVTAWRAVGRRADRDAQLALVLEVGAGLERYTRAPLLMASLKMMRGPSRAAGLSELQSFLERGLDTFRAAFRTPREAHAFLEGVERRERALLERLSDASLPATALTAELPA